jgi:hypothetical protein
MGSLSLCISGTRKLFRQACLLDGIQDLGRRRSGFDLTGDQRNHSRRVLPLVGRFRRFQGFDEVAELGIAAQLHDGDRLERLGLTGRELVNELYALYGRDGFGQLANTARSPSAANYQGVRFRLCLLRHPHRRGDQQGSQR